MKSETPIIKYEVNTDYSTGKSRYQILRVVNESDSRYLETQNQRFIPQYSNDTYHVVDAAEVDRLDIVAKKYYNDPTYWWAIALANELIDPFNIPQGSFLRIPSLITLSEIQNEILTRRGNTPLVRRSIRSQEVISELA